MPEFSALTDYEPRNELSKMGISFVSLCGAGMHPGATVELFKADCTFDPGDHDSHDNDAKCAKCGKPRSAHRKTPVEKHAQHDQKSHGRKKGGGRRNLTEDAGDALGLSPGDSLDDAGEMRTYRGKRDQKAHGRAKPRPKSADQKRAEKNVTNLGAELAQGPAWVKRKQANEHRKKKFGAAKQSDYEEQQRRKMSKANALAATPTGASGGMTPEEGHMPDIQKVDLPDDLPPHVREYVDQLEAAVYDEYEDPLAKADPAVREIVLKAKQDAEEAQRVAKAERETRERAEALAKAESLSGLGFTNEDVAETLLKLRGSDPELAKAVEDMLTSASTAVEKSTLFDEIGSAGVRPTMPKVDALVEDLRKSDPAITREQAEAQVYRAHPSLYAEYRSGKEG